MSIEQMRSKLTLKEWKSVCSSVEGITEEVPIVAKKKINFEKLLETCLAKALDKEIKDLSKERTALKLNTLVKAKDHLREKRIFFSSLKGKEFIRSALKTALWNIERKIKENKEVSSKLTLNRNFTGKKPQEAVK